MSQSVIALSMSFNTLIETLKVNRSVVLVILRVTDLSKA